MVADQRETEGRKLGRNLRRIWVAAHSLGQMEVKVGAGGYAAMS